MAEIPNFKFLLDALAPYEVRLVGGAVRDILLGNEPKDFDFSTTATPDIVTELATYAGAKVRPTGIAHGTVTVIHNGVPSEVTTLRVDKKSDGRWAEIEFTSDWEADAARRDFTFNAMSMDYDGTIYDYFRGEDDLMSGVVRFVGDADKRIKEDYLRIMRYFRFRGRIKTDGSGSSYDTLKILADNIKGLDIISGERIANELQKIIMCYNKNGVMYEMDRIGLLEAIKIPFRISNMAGFTYHNEQKSSFEFILATLFRNEWEVDNFYERVRITGAQKKKIVFLVNNADTPLDRNSIIRLVHSGMSKEQLAETALFQDDKIALQFIEKETLPKFPLTQADVSYIVNMRPRNIKSTYLKLLDKWIESDFNLDKEKLLELGACV